MAEVTKITPNVVSGSHGIKVWGNLLSAWSSATFFELSRRCGGLLEMDPRTDRFKIVIAACLRVTARSLGDIPRLFKMDLEGEEFCLIIEVESLLGFFLS